MEFQTKLHSSPTTETVVNILRIKEIEDLIPSDEDMIQWESDQLEQIENGQEFDPIHIKISFEDFLTILQKLYRKIGMSVDVHNKEEMEFVHKLIRGSWYKEIKQINLYTKKYRIPMIIIET